MSLALWRDISLVVLATEAFVLSLGVLIGLWYGLRGLRWLRERAAHYLRLARYRLESLERGIGLAMRLIALPFIWAQSILAALQTLLRSPHSIS